MKIKDGRLAKVVYTLLDYGDSSVIEEIQKDKPVVFRFGIKHLFPEFEQSLKGLKAGDSFDVFIPAENAFGPIDTYALLDVPKDTFAIDGKVDEGFFLPGKKVSMHDNDGNQHTGRMVKILDDVVTIDFNHPLAGKNLRYKGIIVEVYQMEENK